jgi:hypothetical protein
MSALNTGYNDRYTQRAFAHYLQDVDMSTPQQFIIYQSEDCSKPIDVLLEAQTIWLSQIWMHGPQHQGAGNE